MELEKALSDLDELKRIAEAQRDNLQVERDQLHDEIDELNSVRIEMNDKVEVSCPVLCHCLSNPMRRPPTRMLTAMRRPPLL